MVGNVHEDFQTKIKNAFIRLWGKLTTGITLYMPMSQDQGSSELEEWQETTSSNLLSSNPDPLSGRQVVYMPNWGALLDGESI